MDIFRARTFTAKIKVRQTQLCYVKNKITKKNQKTFILEFWLKCYNKIENQVEGPKIGFQTWEKRFCCYRLIYGEEVFLTTAEKKWNKQKKTKVRVVNKNKFSMNLKMLIYHLKKHTGLI